MQRNLFVLMHVTFLVVLSHLEAGFEPRRGHKDFWTFSLLLQLLLAACCC